MRRTACLLLALSLALSAMPGWAEETPSGENPEQTIEATEKPDEPAETEAPVETDAPTETEKPAETDSPAETQAPVETQEPSEPQNTPTAAPDSTPESTPEPDWDEAWVYAGEGEEQTIVCGKLFDLVQALEKQTEVYLRTDEVVKLEKVNVQKLLLAKLLLDKNYFQGPIRWTLCVSEDDPLAEGASPVEFDPDKYKDALPEDEITVYVWAAVAPDPTESPDPDATESPAPSETPDPDATESPEPTETPDPDAVALTVEAPDYVPGTWSGKAVLFTLSGIPQGRENYSYAAVVYDKNFIVLSGNTYEAAEEGEYTLRLAILDELGDVVSASEVYDLKLDFTTPVLSVETDMEVPYTMHLTASDEGSGLAGFSLDGGETWQEMPEEGVFTLTVKEKTVIPAGMIQAKDLAGNVTVYDQELVLDRIHSGGGGGGGGGGEKPKPHAPSTEKTDANYNAVGLKVSQEPMHTLVMEGEELELTLDVTAAEGVVLPADYEAQFTLSLDTWTHRVLDAEGNTLLVRDGEKPDVLVLSPQIDSQSEKYSLEWRFNGAALRTLYNSGIDYLAIKTGDELTVLPTQGFLAGTKYAELKMAGVSTKKFDFVLRLNVDRTPKDPAQVQETVRPAWLFTDECALSLEVTVEGEKWSLPIGEEAEMYAQDVYCGSAAMLEVPYGEYQEEETK